jgi:hypothetical protein
MAGYFNKKQFISDLIEKVDTTKTITSVEIKELYLKNKGKDGKRVLLNIFQVLYRLGIVSSKYVQSDIEVINFSDEEMEKLRKAKTNQQVSTKRPVEKVEEKFYEVTLMGPSINDNVLDTLLGGKIIQSKGQMYKVQVPEANREKLFSVWLNAEINNLGAVVMIDVELEKKFQKFRSIINSK